MMPLRPLAPGPRTLALAAVFGLAACAGTPAPTAQLGASSEAVMAAERAGALQYAPVELQSARDKLAAAQAAVRDEENERARRLAEQAQVEAELATVRAQAAVTQEAASAVRQTGPASTMSGSSMAPSYGGTASSYGSTMGSGSSGGSMSGSMGGSMGGTSASPYAAPMPVQPAPTGSTSWNSNRGYQGVQP